MMNCSKDGSRFSENRRSNGCCSQELWWSDENCWPDERWNCCQQECYNYLMQKQVCWW